MQEVGSSQNKEKDHVWAEIAVGRRLFLFC